MREFIPTVISFSVPLTDDEMLSLMDSESYATGNAAYQAGAKTLCERLGGETQAQRIDYNGHFGAQIIIELDADDDTVEVKEKISDVIDEHLAWCRTLEIVPHVKNRRRKL